MPDRVLSGWNKPVLIAVNMESISLNTGERRSLEFTAVAVATELTCLANTALLESGMPYFEAQLNTVDFMECVDSLRETVFGAPRIFLRNGEPSCEVRTLDDQIVACSFNGAGSIGPCCPATSSSPASFLTCKYCAPQLLWSTPLDGAAIGRSLIDFISALRPPLRALPYSMCNMCRANTLSPSGCELSARML